MYRCAWAQSNLMISYHDEEWGLPLHDERLLFEFLILEGAQAGLSWSTILQKRPYYRRVFDQFDPLMIADYDEQKFADLMNDPGIVRNQRKIRAAIQNARAFLEVQKEFGSFDAYIWRFVEGKPLTNAWKSLADIPPQTPLSEALSKDLIQRKFAFVGPKVCYAYMQATGMVNDHLVDCFRYQEVKVEF